MLHFALTFYAAEDVVKHLTFIILINLHALVDGHKNSNHTTLEVGVKQTIMKLERAGLVLFLHVARVSLK